MPLQSTGPATAIVVTVEGLGTNLLGAYGNAIGPTPQIDRFAAQAWVADQFWMDACSPTEILTSMWTGRHASRRHGPTPPLDGDGLRVGGIDRNGLLVTDSVEAMEIATDRFPGDAILARSSRDDESAFGSLVRQAVERWLELDSHPLLWIHSKGLMRAWDAPYEYRCVMCDEGDPSPPTESIPPRFDLDENTDPDVIFGWACGAGAQAMVIDEVWGSLESALVELGIAPHCLLVLGGVLGYPLGEHRRIGWPSQFEQIDAPKLESDRASVGASGYLHSELLHAPLIMRPGTALPLGVRFAPLIQPHYLGRWIRAWLDRDGWDGSRAEGASDGGDGEQIESLVAMASRRREDWPGRFRAALAVCGQQSALMVPGWSATWTGSGGADHDAAKLYAMPEDRWQQNEISSRAPEIVQQMRALRDAWLAWPEDAAHDQRTPMDTMEESLWRPHR